MRFRNIYLGIGFLLVVSVLVLTDPDSNLIQHIPFGAGMISTLIVLAVSLPYVGFLHYSRKGLLDYIDLKTLFDSAAKSSTGSGLAIIGVGLMMIAISITIFAATH